MLARPSIYRAQKSGGSYLLDSVGDQVELLDVDQGVQALNHTDAVEGEVQVHQVREVPQVLQGPDTVVVELQFL
jgi:hypothetical protein